MNDICERKDSWGVRVCECLTTSLSDSERNSKREYLNEPILPDSIYVYNHTIWLI